MTVGQGFSENSGGDMTQDGHDYRTYANLNFLIILNSIYLLIILYIIF